MKFMHLGDLHLGRSLGDFDLYDDQKFILDRIIDMAEKEKADAVLVAGDVYDKSVPSEAATGLLDYFLSKLSGSGIKTFVISGNHDSDERLNFGSSLFAANQIFISAKYDGILHKYTCTDEIGEVNVYLLPFVKASQVRRFFPEDEISSYDDAVRVIINHADIDRTQRNILVSHQFVAGKGEDPVLGGSERASTFSVGLVEKISYNCFDGFDYVALGHIHSPQRVGRDEIRYSGSPLKYSLSEVNNDKSVPVITLGEKGDIDIKINELKPLRDMRHIKGTMEKLLSRENVKSPDDFIYVTLTDEHIIDDAMGIFQQTYPNTVKIDYDNSHTREIENVDISDISEKKSFADLITEFYRQMYGCEISEAEMKVMKQVAKEVGVLDETD